MRLDEIILYTVVFFSPSIGLLANPSNPCVKIGDAEFHKLDPLTLEIHSKDGTIIHWDSFSIDMNETTRFLLPSKDAALLNRVIGNLPSSIAGLLESNGKIFLINPNGILVSETGVINTASFIASTLDALDVDFLAGKGILFKGESRATIQNLGTINASEGDLFLIAHNIDNQGKLSGKKGVVGLGAGTEVFLKIGEDERIIIKTDSSNFVQDEEGIIDSGWIEALQVEIKADGSAYTLGINHSGQIQALGIEEVDGRILLVAEEGIASSSGHLVAKNSDETGGTIHILGKKVAVLDGARLDAAGQLDGGTVLVGGDFQGSNEEILNSETTYVGGDVAIDVSSKENGDGGKAIIWSDNCCYYSGYIDAQGGKEAGDGGFVEISGKRHLDFLGLANTMASNGKTGTLLLDPTNITIGAPSAAFHPYMPVGGTFQLLSLIDNAAGMPTNLDLVTIGPALGMANLVIQAMPDTLQSVASPLGLSAGDIVVVDGFDPLFMTPNNLTLNAAHNIYLHGRISYMMTTGDVNLIAGEEIRIEPHRLSMGPPTVSPGVNIFGGTIGTGNISLRGKSVSVFGNSDLMGGIIPAGLHTSSGSITVHASDGDITLQGGTELMSPAASEFLAETGPIMITTEKGSLNLIGAQTSTAGMGSTARIEATSDSVLINADLGVNLIGGRGILAPAEIFAGQGINLSTSEGDVILEGGNNMMGGGSPAQIIAGRVSPRDLVINANSGNVVLTGGTSGGSPALLQSGDTMMMMGGGNVIINAYGTNGVTLLGGDGVASPAQIRTFLPASGATSGSKISINAHNGSLNLTGSQISGFMSSSAQIVSASSISFYTGFDCNLTGGLGVGMAPNNSASFMEAATGVDGVVNGSLNLLAGGDPMMGMGENPAYISNSGGNINLSIGANLSLVAGGVTNSFAQIGSRDTSAMMIFDSNIVISKVGGDVSLVADQSMLGGTNNYAAIGHGNLAGGMANFVSGDIVFTNGIGGNLKLYGGTTNNAGTFAQIGHFGGMIGGGFTNGNIRINEVGNSIILDPAFDYAMIGHGTNTTPPGQVFGDIIIYSSIGNCTLKQSQFAGATDAFSQIGHMGTINVGGDIRVHIGGPLKLLANDTQDSIAIIGHGNPAVMAMPSFSGNIDVNAETIQIIGGDASGSHAQIGMFNQAVTIPANMMGTPFFTTRTSIDVQAAGDIDIQAGGPTQNAGNALIGYGPDTFGGSITIDNITVTSLEGNITLNGGNSVMGTGGVSFIGLLNSPGVNPEIFQSDLTINCPNGALTLNGTLPAFSGMGTTGRVLIQNGIPGMMMNIPASPFNLTLNAAEVMMNTGGSQALGNLGFVLINSTRNITVQTTRDFQIVSPSGSIQVLAGGDVVFHIGHDMVLEGSQAVGPGTNIIGTFYNLANQYQKMDFNIGNDLFLKPNANGDSSFEIGRSPFNLMTPGQIVDINFTIGHDFIMQGGAGMTASQVLGIGTADLLAVDQMTRIRFDVADNINLTAGSSNTQTVRIGPAIMGTGGPPMNQLVEISMKAGGNLLMQCGNDMGPGSVFIGSPTMLNPSQTLMTNFDIRGNMTLNGNDSTMSFCQIGPSSMVGGFQNFTLNASVGDDLLLMTKPVLGGGGGSVLIGPTSLMGQSQKVSMNFTTGGDLTLQNGSGTFCVIGTDPTSTGMATINSDFTINCNVEKDLNLYGLSGVASIGPRDISINGNVCEMGFSVHGSLSIEPGSGPTAWAGIGLDPTATGLTGTNHRILIDCEVDQSLFMRPTSSGNNSFIGPFTIGANNVTSTTRVTVGGDAVILSSTTQGTNQSIIGPSTITGSDVNVLVEANCAGDLLLRLGNQAASHVYLGAPNLIGDSISLAVNLNVGKNLILDGGTGTNSFCQIGPQTTMAGGMGQFQSYYLNIRTGGDVTLFGGTGSNTQSLIGAQIMAGASGVGLIHFDIGGDLTLQGKSGTSCPCHIGVARVTPNTVNDIIFNRIGGDVNLIPGSGGGSWVHIGHGFPVGASPVGDILFREVAGNFSVGVPSAVFPAPGASSFAQVGHFGGNGVLTGDVFVNVLGGVTVRSGTGMNGSAVIGHGNSLSGNSTVVGSVQVRGSSVNLDAGGNPGGSDAVIGFASPGGMFSGNSTLVEVLSQGEIYLTAGQGANAVIGFFQGGATTNLTIGTVNASAITGNIFLDGGAGGTAIIGTRSGGNICHSNVKVTAARDLILFANTGSALIANNQVAPPAPDLAYSTTIDPISVILLGGTMGGTASITSSGNAIINFDDRLDINFDSFGGALQGGNAFIAADGDVQINTAQSSFGSINIQGSMGAFIGQITADGNVYIGTNSAPGAGDINVGFVDGSTGSTLISSGLGTQINAAGDINIQNGNGVSAITSTGEISLISGDTVLLNGVGTTAQVTTSGGSIDITAANNIIGAINAGFLATNGALASEIALDAGLDVQLRANATITNSGTGDITVDAGQDLNVSNGATIVNSLTGSIVVGVARDVVVTGGGLTNMGTGSIEMLAGRDVSNGAVMTTGGGSILGTAGRDVINSGSMTVTLGSGDLDLEATRNIINTGAMSNISGAFLFDAGDDISLQAGVATSTAGSMNLNAGRTIQNNIPLTVSSGAGSMEFAAGQNVNIAGPLSHVSTGTIAIEAGVDVNIGSGVSTSLGNIRMDAVRNVNVSGATSVGGGTGNMEFSGGQYVNVTSPITHTSSGTVAISAGDDINIANNVASSAGDIQMNAVRDINMSGGTVSTGGSQIIYGNARNDINISGAGARVSQSGSGEVLLIAGRDMSILGTSTVTTNFGFLTLVVDDLFPDPPKYGRGFFTLAGGASVNAGGGELRVYTSRQPFNSIAGTLNGAGFVAGVPYVDTTQETWDSYYYRSLIGAPFMVFYKDSEPTIPPVPPPTPPPLPPGTNPGVFVPFRSLNKFWTAISEAIRNWENYDEFNFGAAEFEFTYKCSTGGFSGGLSVGDAEVESDSSVNSCSPGTETFKFLRQGYRNYNTKKLDTKY